MLFGKHNLSAKDTIHKNRGTCTEEIRKAESGGSVGCDNPRKCETKQHKIYVTFSSVLLVSDFVEVRRSLLPPLSGKLL